MLPGRLRSSATTAGIGGTGGAYSGGAVSGISSSPTIPNGTPVERCEAAAFLRAVSYSRTFSDSAACHGLGTVRVDLLLGDDAPCSLG